MANSCVYSPKKGAKTFYKLKKEFGYSEAWRLYGIAVNSKFKNDYKDSLSLDAEGVPTFESLMNNEYILRTATSKIRAFLGKNFPKREDTIDNFNLALEEAKTFNQSSPHKESLIATVGYDEDGNIKVSIVNRTPETEKKFAEQYATNLINKRLAEILKSLGVNIGLLKDIEQMSGRVGVTDFSIAKRLATDSISMIRIANNMEGAQALSEEFSHLIIGAMRNTPLLDRNITQLSNEGTLREILGDDYQDVYEYYDGDLTLMAEEALGHILQERLLTEILKDSTNLQDRLVKQIQSKFKRIQEIDIARAINEADSSMSELAGNILKGNLEISKKDIIASQRNVQFNALSTRIERNISILKEAIATESKRLKITRDSEKSQDYITGLITDLERDMGSKDTSLGVLRYAREAVKALSSAQEGLNKINLLDSGEKFRTLLGIKSTILSYSGFIDSLNEAALAELKEEENDFLRDIVIEDKHGHHVLKIRDTLKELNDLYKLVGKNFQKVAIPAFAEYLKPILGEEITIEMGKKAGSKISIESLLKSSESDISLLDRWLDSMGNSSDILLRAFDKIYKNAIDEARLKSIEDFRRIQALMQEAESYGITSYEWMFERYDDGSLTGDYISEVNTNQYYKDLKEHEKYLEDTYGKNPKGQALQDKLRERQEWYLEHSTLTMSGERIPNSKYENAAFQNLSSKQKLIREKFLKLKEEMDNHYPPNRVSELKAIQLRKDGVQRFIDSSKDPSSIWTNIKEHLKEEFVDRADDDTLFGGRTGLLDFEGKEFRVLPVLFTSRLENPSELSTDIFGSLMAYAASANKYSALDSIIDPLEIGRGIIRDYRKTKVTRGGFNLSEKFSALGRTFQKEAIQSEKSNALDRLEDFFASQLYSQYYKDSGVFNILGTKANKNKLVSLLMQGSSLAQLGFNYLTNLANVVTGVAMQNIEACSREFFSSKELLKADGIYVQLVGGSLAELNSRTKKNKLSLFNELFNINNDFDNITHKSLRKSWIARIFSADIAYLGQSAGDHWLYMRTAIAMALREKVIVPNKGEMSLWDALEIVNSFKDNNDIMEMKLPEGTTDINGNPFSIGKFSRKIAHVNQSLFGIYNNDDREAAQRVIMGRLLTQYRRWMKPQFNRRFMRKQYNLDIERDEEGYYRTSARIVMGLIRGEYQLGAVWENLNAMEKANVRRTISEMVQLTAIVLLAEFIEWPDDKNRPWAIKLAEYSAKRLEHELGALAPSPIMLQELAKTVKSPIPSITQVQNLINLFTSLMDPRDWTDELQSGRYEGLSTLEKNALKSGLPGLAQFQQFDKLIYDMDNAINYYARPY